MIVANTFPIEPTRFPDGTTQVWKLPAPLLQAESFLVEWRFEREDEFFSIAQLRMLIPGKRFWLHIPYLPYARQDKEIANDQTFSLHAFANLLNVLRCDKVTAVDVHNPGRTSSLIRNFENISPQRLHAKIVGQVEPDLIVFPDAGARSRYPWLSSYAAHVVYDKERDPATGKVLKHVLTKEGSPELLADGKRLLIMDDICDGGATFLSIAKAVKAEHKDVKLHLFVTHGLYSKGESVLVDAGFTLYTTNSLPRNKDGMEV